MRVFNKPNKSAGWKCPICKTNKESEVVLIGVAGTQKGYNMEAEQFHLSCIDLLFSKELGIIYQKVKV